MKRTLLIAIIPFTAVLIARAQDAKPIPTATVTAEKSPTADTIPFPEVDKFHGQALEATASKEDLWMQTVIRNFIDSTPQVKEHQANFGKSTAELEALKEKIWAECKCKADYDIDFVKGQLVKKPKPDEAKKGH